MPVPFLDLSLKDPLKAEIERKLLSKVASSEFIGGEEVALFEKEFADYCGGGACVGVANGTDALILALRELGIGAGDEVVTAPFTFIASAEAITAVGASVKFVDINPKNYTLDTALLERAVGPRSKAIIAVHLFGQPVDMEAVLSIAQRHRLKVIEDAAQAHGAEYKGKRVGLLGDAGCFSFYPTKNLGAFGDAGAVISCDAGLIKRMAQRANHGRTHQYFHEIVGVNSRLDTLQAAVLRMKLKFLEEWNNRRREIAVLYTKALQNHLYISPPFIESYSKHVFHLYCVETSHRDSLIQFLQDHKIGQGVYYPLPLHLQPAYATLGYKRGDFPVAERVSERILALPMHPNLTDEQVKEVCETLAFFKPKVRGRS